MTPDDLDRVLPRVATWPPTIYDLTDPKRRKEACEWLAKVYADAERRSGILHTFTQLGIDERDAVQMLTGGQLGTTFTPRSPETALSAPESDERDEDVPRVRTNVETQHRRWHDISDGGWPRDLTPEQIASTYKGGTKVLRRLEQYGYLVVKDNSILHTAQLFDPWPPPAKGTHESDLETRGAPADKPDGTYDPTAWYAAWRWSRS